jgi:regulation of enolase protein 1 (concanavalin A-like superfamily)
MGINCPNSIVLYAAETLLAVNNTTEHDLDFWRDAFNAYFRTNAHSAAR